MHSTLEIIEAEVFSVDRPTGTEGVKGDGWGSRNVSIVRQVSHKYHVIRILCYVTPHHVDHLHSQIVAGSFGSANDFIYQQNSYSPDNYVRCASASNQPTTWTNDNERSQRQDRSHVSHEELQFAIGTAERTPCHFCGRAAAVFE